MNDASDRVAAAIKGAAALAALAPGVAMLFGAVNIPPTAADLTKALSLTTEVVVVLVIMLGGNAIARTTAKKVMLICLALLAAGIGLGIGYYEVGGRHIIDYVDSGRPQRIIVPIFPDVELREYRDGLGGYPEALANPIVGGRVADLIDEQNGMTVPAVVLLLLLAQACLLIAIVAGAWKFASTQEPPREKQ